MNTPNVWGQPSPQSNPVPKDPIAEAWDSFGRDAVLMQWQKLQKDLAAAKEAEMEFRKYVVKRAFPNPTEGTNTQELGNGYQLKAGIKFNYKLKDNDTVKLGLAEIAKIGNDGSFIADRLVSWTPNFLLTEYRQLQEDCEKGDTKAIGIMKIINSFLEITEAAPSLEIKEPKAKKK